MSRTLRLRSQCLEDEHEHSDGATSVTVQVAAFGFVPWTSVALASCMWEMTSVSHLCHTLCLHCLILNWTLSQVKNRLGDARTCLTFVLRSVCPFCGLVGYTGPPDVALMMPFYENCCMSAESDWFWFCVFIESASHKNKLITLNVNVFTGKIRSLLMSHKVFGGNRYIYYLSIPHYGAGTCRDSTYTLPRCVCFEVIWIMFLLGWLPVSMER